MEGKALFFFKPPSTVFPLCFRGRIYIDEMKFYWKSIYPHRRKARSFVSKNSCRSSVASFKRADKISSVRKWRALHHHTTKKHIWMFFFPHALWLTHSYSNFISSPHIPLRKSYGNGLFFLHLGCNFLFELLALRLFYKLDITIWAFWNCSSKSVYRVVPWIHSYGNLQLRSLRPSLQIFLRITLAILNSTFQSKYESSIDGDK